MTMYTRILEKATSQEKLTHQIKESELNIKIGPKGVRTQKKFETRGHRVGSRRIVV
jgi:hypothetical protein